MNAMRTPNPRSTRRGATWRSGQETETAEVPVQMAAPVTPDMDEMMVEVKPDSDGTERVKPWQKPGAKIKKKKKVPGAKNLRIRKYVQPKNAVMCLNELKPGLSYVTETAQGVSVHVCVSVEVDGQKYKGFGSSKAMAKQAAAEAALISFVKPPPQGSNPTDDKTPWATLASFAIFKLFNEWREGRVGMMPPQASQLSKVLSNLDYTDFATNMGFLSSSMAGAIQPPTAAAAVAAPQPMETTPTKAATEVVIPKPAKTLPENAVSIHPSVVLHQMRPGLQYNIEISTRNNQKYFVASTIIDGQQFTGEGQKVKKAKFQLAKHAVKVLFGIDSSFEMTN